MTTVEVSAPADEQAADQDRQEAIDLFLQLCDLEEDELLRAVERLDAERAPR